jgi:hypothetical protein
MVGNTADAGAGWLEFEERREKWPHPAAARPAKRQNAILALLLRIPASAETSGSSVKSAKSVHRVEPNYG